MRISIIDPSLFTLPYDRKLAQGLVQLGHEVALRGRPPNPTDPSLDGPKIETDFYRLASTGFVARLPRPLRLGVKSADHVWSMWRLLRTLRRHAPDIIHFQWLPLPLADLAMLSSFRAIAPLILTVHDTDPFNGDPSSILQRHAMERCHAQFDHLIVHTKQGEERLKARGTASRVAVLPHGLLSDTEMSEAPDTTDGPLTFLLFGKLKRYKGADILLEAFAALPERLRARARVRVVGMPYMDLAPLERLVEEKGMAAQVSIEPRFVPDEELGGLFGRNTVAVFPYREIEASGVLFLALAHGRPVVASRLGSFVDLITDGVQGHLTKPEDVGELTRALAHFVEDRNFAVACSHAARTTAAAVAGWGDIARLTEEVYRQSARSRVQEPSFSPSRLTDRRAV